MRRRLVLLLPVCLELQMVVVVVVVVVEGTLLTLCVVTNSSTLAVALPPWAPALHTVGTGAAASVMLMRNH